MPYFFGGYLTDLVKIEKLPDYRDSVRSIYQTLGKSYNKHDNITTLSRHMPKDKRWFCKLVVKVFYKEGLLCHHRSDTYSWTEQGLRYAEAYLNPPSGGVEKIVATLREVKLFLETYNANTATIFHPQKNYFY